MVATLAAENAGYPALLRQQLRCCFIGRPAAAGVTGAAAHDAYHARRARTHPEVAPSELGGAGKACKALERRDEARRVRKRRHEGAQEQRDDRAHHSKGRRRLRHCCAQRITKGRTRARHNRVRDPRGARCNAAHHGRDGRADALVERQAATALTAAPLLPLLMPTRRWEGAGGIALSMHRLGRTAAAAALRCRRLLLIECAPVSAEWAARDRREAPRHRLDGDEAQRAVAHLAHGWQRRVKRGQEGGRHEQLIEYRVE